MVAHVTQTHLCQTVVRDDQVGADGSLNALQRPPQTGLNIS